MEKIKYYLNKLIYSSLWAGVVYAEDEGRIDIPQPTILPPHFTFGGLFSALISLFIIIAFLAAFFYLLIGAFQWITSGGDETKLGEARNKILHAIIGLVLVVRVWVIFSLIEKFLGISIITGGGIDIPTIGGD